MYASKHQILDEKIIMNLPETQAWNEVNIIVIQPFMIAYPWVTVFIDNRNKVLATLRQGTSS